MQKDSGKSQTIYWLGALVLLVLFDKSIKSESGMSVNAPEFKTGFRFQNVGKPSLFKNKDKEDSVDLSDLEFEKDLETEELLEEEIPTVEDPIPTVSTPKKKEFSNEKTISVYFLKFFGSDQSAHTKLVKVTRRLSGSNPVVSALDELKRGPSEQEREKGVLNAIPYNLKFNHDYHLNHGILEISVGHEIEMGGSPSILRDRLDQLVYTLMEIEGVRGVKLKINDETVKTIGGDGLPIPEVMTRGQRKIIIL